MWLPEELFVYSGGNKELEIKIKVMKELEKNETIDYNEVFEQLRRKLRKNLGVVKFGMMRNREQSWLVYNNEQYKDDIEATYVCFMPEKDDYKLCFSILGDKKIGLHYLEITKKGKGKGT